MPDSELRYTDYSLAEAAILSQRWLSAEPWSDVLTRPAVVTARVEPPQPTRVVIRKMGAEVSVEFHAGGPLPPSFVKSVEGVVDLLSLPEGWNSYSARPIGTQNAIRAIQLLGELLGSETPPPVVVPTVRGGIQLEWHTRGVNIEIYVESPENVSFFAEEVGSGESCEEPLAGHEPELSFWLQRISGE